MNYLVRIATYNKEIAINMWSVFIVLMPEYGNKFLQGFYIEFKNKSYHISLLEEIFRKTFKWLTTARNNCKKYPV